MGRCLVIDRGEWGYSAGEFDWHTVPLEKLRDSPHRRYKLCSYVYDVLRRTKFRFDAEYVDWRLDYLGDSSAKASAPTAPLLRRIGVLVQRLDRVEVSDEAADAVGKRIPRDQSRQFVERRGGSPHALHARGGIAGCRCRCRVGVRVCSSTSRNLPGE